MSWSRFALAQILFMGRFLENSNFFGYVLDSHVGMKWDQMEQNGELSLKLADKRCPVFVGFLLDLAQILF